MFMPVWCTKQKTAFVATFKSWIWATKFDNHKNYLMQLNARAQIFSHYVIYKTNSIPTTLKQCFSLLLGCLQFSDFYFEVFYKYSICWPCLQRRAIITKWVNLLISWQKAVTLQLLSVDFCKHIPWDKVWWGIQYWVCDWDMKRLNVEEIELYRYRC